MEVCHEEIGIQQAFRILEEGGIVIHPTETCYGLGCDLTHAAAVERLFALKQRPSDLPISALFASIEDSSRYVVWNENAHALAKRYLPGPLTLILPLKPDIPRLYQAPHTSSAPPSATLGIRISSHPLACALAETFPRPMSTTSANLHGCPPCYNLKDIEGQFTGRDLPDLFLDGGDLPGVPPSPVVDCTGEKPKILRGTIDLPAS
jgi:L-threonylcarbamoyladenylate synthase